MLFIHPLYGMRSIVLSMSVCEIVCCLLAHLDINTSEFRQSLYKCYSRPWLGLVIECDMLCISGFVNGVMFPYNGGNRSESKTRRMFRLVLQVAAPATNSTVQVTSCSTLFWRCQKVAKLTNNTSLRKQWTFDFFWKSENASDMFAS